MVRRARDPLPATALRNGLLQGLENLSSPGRLPEKSVGPQLPGRLFVARDV